MPRPKQTVDPPPARRSVCPLACGLDLFGDRWTLLVVRDLLAGDLRFKDFTGSPENIPTNLLSERLARLLSHGVIVQVMPPDGSKHLAYRLTAKGEALRPILGAMRDWGLHWEPGTEALIETATPMAAGKPMQRASPHRRKKHCAARTSPR